MNNIITIRASSLADLFDCPKRWYTRNILKKSTPASSRARLGTSIHAGTEIYDLAKLQGNPISVDDAADAVIETLYEKYDHDGEEIDWGDESPKQLENIALALHTKYCVEIGSKTDYKAVEVRCNPVTFEDIGIKLTGSVDRIYQTEDGELGIADIKTGATAVSADGTVKTGQHIAQLGVYNMLAELTLQEEITGEAKIIGLNTGKTPAAQRVGVGSIPNPKNILLGDDENKGFLEQAASIVQSGVFYANPKSMLCNPKFCPAHPNCKYRGS